MRANRILGIALSPESLSVAEITINGNGRRKLLHASDFAFPANLSLATPAELGKAFAQHLKTHHVSTRDAAVGAPAKWFVTRRKELPPARPEIAAASLRLQAEAEFASELNSLVIDYAGDADPAQPSSALLVATSRTNIDACNAFARAAGLHLYSITATGFALAEASSENLGRSAILHVTRSAAELVIQNNGSPIFLSHIALPPAATDAPASLANEMRRALAGTSAKGKTNLVLSSNSQVDPGLSTALADRLSIPVAVADIASRVHSDEIDPHHFAPSIAVGLSALSGARSPVNLVASRLAPPRSRMSRRPFVWAAALVATLIIAGIIAVTDLHSRQRELADMNQRLDAMADDIKTAEARAQRLAFARNWAPRQPQYLSCLAALTNLFPDEGSIYATNLALRENMAGQVSGKASSNQQILSLLDRMKDDRHFASPKLLDMREAGQSTRDVAFTIGFSFRPLE